jgi:dTDP-4-amino-4,6-dideoxygalactose transaminase
MIPIAKPTIGEDEISAVTAVLRSGIIAQGKKVEEFEGAFAEFIGTKYAVAVNSGTAALHIGLLSYGIGEGDEVITSPFTFIATANSILFTGAKPVFADIEEDSFNIAPDSLAEKITLRTKAIMPVHLYGQPCDMKRIMRIAQEHGHRGCLPGARGRIRKKEGRLIWHWLFLVLPHEKYDHRRRWDDNHER